MRRETESLIRRKVRQYFSFLFRWIDIRRLKKKEFVIISKNCWGGQLYHWLGIPYNTPFVGLFLFGPCYIKLLEQFDYYIQQDLVFIEHSRYKTHLKHKYPIGLLGDLEIHFQHYSTQEEVRDKWKRRLKRMNLVADKDNFYFTICERRETNKKIIKRFHKLPFKNKISFSLDRIESLNNKQHIQVEPSAKKKDEMFYNGKKLFKLTFMYVDIINWINTGNVLRTRLKG